MTANSPRHSPSRGHAPSLPLKLPGFGLPLDKPYGDKKAFPAVIDVLQDGAYALPLTTLREFAMMELMDEITDKPGWERKVFDDAICAKWKTEAVRPVDEDNAGTTRGVGMTEKMVDWVLDELRWKAGVFTETGGVAVYDGDVVKSDTIVSPETKKLLQDAMVPLENVPDVDKDWHPGSDGMVLDVVHPSLFPLVYGRSRILPDSLCGLRDCIRRAGEGVVIPVPPKEQSHEILFCNWDLGIGSEMIALFSRKFQWLPCDISLSSGQAKIVSYINNLHPRHYSLYMLIEKIIDHAIPLWNMTLTAAQTPNISSPRIPYYDVVYDPDPDAMPADQQPQQERNEEDDAFQERFEAWEDSIRKVVQPEPQGPWKLPVNSDPNSIAEHPAAGTPEQKVDLARDYVHSGLQVIVKLANIVLTPSQPSYSGGVWHFEGQVNERIVSTAIYYYSTENTTPSRLAFRKECEFDDLSVSYLQHHHEWLTEVFGCSNEGRIIQEIGSIGTPEGRLLTFPNVLQHRVSPFELADKTRPGHRKILALFLVDPDIRIISTANVPPQQHGFWAQEAAKEEPLVSLPPEMKAAVLRETEEWPIGVLEAKGLRDELMEERRLFVEKGDLQFGYEGFSLCEH